MYWVVDNLKDCWYGSRIMGPVTNITETTQNNTAMFWMTESVVLSDDLWSLLDATRFVWCLGYISYKHMLQTYKQVANIKLTPDFILMF